MKTASALAIQVLKAVSHLQPSAHFNPPLSKTEYPNSSNTPLSRKSPSISLPCRYLSFVPEVAKRRLAALAAAAVPVARSTRLVGEERLDRSSPREGSAGEDSRVDRAVRTILGGTVVARILEEGSRVAGRAEG